MSRRLAVGLVALASVLGATAPLDAYLQLTATARGQVVRLTWGASPVRWYVSNVGAPGVTAAEFQTAVNSAFGTWQAVPTASIAFQFVGFTGAAPSDEDGLSVLGFESHPEEDRTLAATSFTIDTVTGQIVESDVFFNTAFPWSTTGAASAFDLQSVATHEIGHVVGLGHSALGETELQSGGGRRVLATSAVMFPIAFGRGITVDRTLQPDDIAGVSDLYPDGGFTQDTGTVQGRVLIGGRGLFGAHVAAFNPATRALVGGFVLGRNGEFQIAGLTPGPHIIRVEPLDDASTDSFFDETTTLDINFRVTFSDRLVVAPSGGAGPSFDVTVTPK